MSHKHHSCSCKHEDVKYCSTCQVVHCRDCNREWTQRVTTNWYNTPQWSYNLGNAGTSTAKDPEITLTSKTTCEHK